MPSCLQNPNINMQTIHTGVVSSLENVKATPETLDRVKSNIIHSLDKLKCDYDLEEYSCDFNQDTGELNLNINILPLRAAETINFHFDFGGETFTLFYFNGYTYCLFSPDHLNVYSGKYSKDDFITARVLKDSDDFSPVVQLTSILDIFKYCKEHLSDIQYCEIETEILRNM